MSIAITYVMYDEVLLLHYGKFNLTLTSSLSSWTIRVVFRQVETKFAFDLCQLKYWQKGKKYLTLTMCKNITHLLCTF